MNRPALEQDLRHAIRGDVFFDDVTRGIYATDASNYQIQPVAVVVPRDRDDVKAAVEIAARHEVSILPRGGGTSLAGQTVGASLVLDFSKHMNRILKLDVEGRWVRVEPGLVRDELNAAVAEHGLHFAPDPATASRANVGGMIGNNSSGTKSILFGKTVDHVLALEVLLADGSVIELGEMDPTGAAAPSEGDRREEIVHGLRRLVEANRDEIAARYPKVMRRVGGYPLDELLEGEGWNPAKILVGSEGTLGLTLAATLRLQPLPAHTSVCVAHFSDVLEAIRAVEHILPFTPSAVEILDHTILELARKNLKTAPLCDFLEGDPGAVLIVEFYGETAEDVEARPCAMQEALAAQDLGFAYPLFLDAGGQAKVWTVRKNGLGLMLGMKGDRKPLPFIEDAAIPIADLPEYVDRVLAICREVEVEVAMYAHASVGVIHLRPILDLRQQGDIDKMQQIAERTFQLVQHYGGAWSGEHGDGLVRSPFNARFFGPQIYRALQEVKALFDPQGLMNPGKIVEAPPMDHNLRFGAGYQAPPEPTLYQYRADGSFQAAVEMCSGVGQCRKTLGGTMCPSYIATRDEEHSTRGRANALRLAMSGQLGTAGLTNPRLQEVLELCLSCKACKAECPSNVDMAKLKSEVMQQQFDRHGVTLRDRLVRRSAEAASTLGGGWAPLWNALQRSRPVRRLLQATAGIHAARTLPTYAREPLASQLARRNRTGGGDRPKVALFADTYINHHEPHIGLAAVELLESCGYEVELAEVGCCQRPRLSHGFLRAAQRDGEATLRGLDEFVRRGVPVVVCEPSCASALTDDLPDLMDDAELAERVGAGVSMIDVFLDRERAEGRLEGRFVGRQGTEKILIHGHCHQKALFGTAAMQRLMGEVPGLEVTEVDSGCCGMAGAFGYEREHYELSRRIGEDRLFPAIRQLEGEGEIVACGFSCRHQIEHFTGRRARHWVETVLGTSGSEAP
ncbi:MAG: FAD-linked oxidase C-terminal domain-containing protein [Acidobacteriota bacterium]